MCRREMNTLSGSQTKVHESLQEYLHQVKELQHELDGTKKHMSRVSRDYGVCQDTSAHLRFHVRQTKVRLLLMNSKALLKYSMVGINS